MNLQKTEDDFSKMFNKDTYIFILYLLIAFIVFFPSYDNLKFFWDDERFIFMNPSFTQAPGWVYFWNPFSSFYKTWPMGYTFFWMIIKYSPFKAIAFYKTINILIHSINAFLVYKFIKQIKLPYSAFVAIVFLIHPLHVETVSWVFQIFTLISFSFFMLALLQIYNFLETSKKNSLLFSYLFFFLSLSAKSIAALAPFIFLFLFFRYKKRFWTYLFLIPFFMMSLYYGISSQFGTENLTNQTQKPSISRQFISVIKNNYPTLVEKNKDAVKKNAESIYFDFTFNTNAKADTIIFDRWSILANGSWYYVSRALIPIGLQFIHKTSPPSLMLFLLALCLIFIIPVIFFSKTSDSVLLLIPGLSFVFLIPYLGLSFITFFYWSEFSDRYTYYFLVVLSITLATAIKYYSRNGLKIFLSFYLIILFITSINYGIKFNNPKKLYTEILSYKPHPAIYSLLFEQYLMELNLKESGEVLHEGLKKFPDNKRPHLYQAKHKYGFEMQFQRIFYD